MIVFVPFKLYAGMRQDEPICNHKSIAESSVKPVFLLLVLSSTVPVGGAHCRTSAVRHDSFVRSGGRSCHECCIVSQASILCVTQNRFFRALIQNPSIEFLLQH